MTWPVTKGPADWPVYGYFWVGRGRRNSLRQPLRHDFSWIGRCWCISPDSTCTPAVQCQMQCREVCLVGILIAELAHTMTVLFWQHSAADGLLASTLTCRRHKLKCAAGGQELHQKHRICRSGCHRHEGENAAPFCQWVWVDMPHTEGTGLVWEPVLVEHSINRMY